MAQGFQRALDDGDIPRKTFSLHGVFCPTSKGLILELVELLRDSKLILIFYLTKIS